MVAAPNVPVDLWILLPALLKNVKGLEILIYWTAHFLYSFVKKYDNKLIILEKLPFSESTVKILLFVCFKYLTFILFCSVTLYKVSDFFKKNDLDHKHLLDLSKGSIFKQLWKICNTAIMNLRSLMLNSIKGIFLYCEVTKSHKHSYDNYIQFPKYMSSNISVPYTLHSFLILCKINTH